MEEGKEDVVGCVCEESSVVDIIECREGEETDGLVWGWTGSEYGEGGEE